MDLGKKRVKLKEREWWRKRHIQEAKRDLKKKLQGAENHKQRTKII